MYNRKNENGGSEMSTKLFTEKEREILSRNYYIKAVSIKTITYTDEFKNIFIVENEKGKFPREIFEEHGFDYAITGADGEKIPKGLTNYCVKHVEKKDFESKGIVYRGSCTYTDINELGIYIFDKKKGK